MTTAIRIAEILSGEGWYAVPSWSLRASDNAIIWRVNWRGGEGEAPLDGWLTERGDLTQDVSQAMPFPAGTVPVIGSDAVGVTLGTMEVPAATVAGDLPTNWENVNDRAVANNNENPGDTGAKLRLPTELEGDENGLAFIVNYNGENKATFRYWGVTDPSVDVVLAPDIVMRFNVQFPSDGERPYVTCRLQSDGDGDALPNDANVRVAMAPATITDLDVTAMRAHVNQLQNEYDALKRQVDASGQGIVPTDITGFSLSGRTLTLQWERLGHEHHADVPLPAPHTFELVHDDAELAAASTADTLLVTGAITGPPAFIAGDVLVHDGSAWLKVINLGDTSRAIPDGSISKRMLSNALKDALDAAITDSTLESKLKASPLVQALRRFMSALRLVSPLAGGDWTQNTSSAYERLGTQTWPLFKDDDILTVSVQRDGAAQASTTLQASAFEGYAAAPSQVAGTANGVAVVNRVNNETYWISKGTGRQVLVASDTAGTHTLTSAVDSITINVADQIPDGAIHEDKLSDDLKRKIDATGIDANDVRSIVHGILANVDAIASKTVAPVVEADGHTVPVALAFNVDDTAFTLDSLFIPANGDVSAYVQPDGSRNNAAFLGFDIAYEAANGDTVTLKIANARRTTDTSAHDLFRWQDDYGGRPQPANPCQVDIIAPPTKANSVPGTGPTGYPLTQTRTCNTFDNKLDGANIANGTIGSAQMGNNSVERDAIFDNAVNGDKIAASVRNPDATHADDDQYVKTQGGVYVLANAPRPRIAITQLMDGAGTGQSITNSSQDRRQPLHGFSPTFDLDDHSVGIVEVQARLTLSNRSSTSFGFDESLHPPATFEFVGFAFASRLLAAADYLTSANNGVQIGNTGEIFFGQGTKIGEYQFWLGHNSDNELGYFLDYNGDANNQTWSAAIHIDAAFLHGDAPSS